MAQTKDNWNTDDYQSAASFVPKLATKVVSWLDLKKDDVVLDIGCGGTTDALSAIKTDLIDGILNAEFANVVAQGNGSIHGIDSSDQMIQAARKLCAEAKKCTFQTLDAADLSSLPKGVYTKVFSNAAMHWILASPSTRATFFPDVATLLPSGGIFSFEMGGLGNVAEMKAAILLAVSRRCLGGNKQAVAACPWFFPDEAWASAQLKAAGFRVDRVEREWRPTIADKAGVEGWVRLFGAQMLDVLEGNVREEAVAEAAEVLREVCRTPDGGEMISYVRLRALATKL